MIDMKQSIDAKQYDIYMADLPCVEGSHVLQGPHPIVIISNNRVNKSSPVLTVIPMTSRMKRMDLPTHVWFQAPGLRKPSLALCEQIQSIDRDSIMYYMGCISSSHDRMALVKAIGIHIGVAA